MNLYSSIKGHLVCIERRDSGTISSKQGEVNWINTKRDLRQL